MSELARLDRLLSCDWNDGRGLWEIYRKPRIVKYRGTLCGRGLFVAEPELFHILTVKKTNLATMDWRVIERLNQIDLWARYGENLSQYHRDLDNRVKEDREGKQRKARAELDHAVMSNMDGVRGMKENLRRGRDPFWTPEVRHGRKHFSYPGQRMHGYKRDMVESRRG